MKLPNMEEAKVRTKNPVEYIYNNNKSLGKPFKNKKYFLRTYGCQMNVHDSEAIAHLVEDLGYTSTDEIKEADLVVLNTCAIRENVHDKVFGYLSVAKHLKTKKDLTIVLTGCMMQQEVAIEEIQKKHKYIDIIIGTHNIHELPELLIERAEKQDIEVYSFEGNVIENIQFKRDSNIKAWVNIMYGCNNFCTYCIVPYVRGKQRSRLHEDIINEIETLVKNGYQEVTLLGQNVNSYGLDLEDEISFAELVKLVSDTRINRIRFVTSNPWDLSDELIDVVAERDNVMPYIHLPIQSGSSEVLSRMNRKYTKESYLELFNKIKTKIPECSITTDIIVGFPNETENEFNETLDVIRTCKYDGAFTFIYSPREETIAAKIEDKLSLKEKENRLQELNKLVNKYSLENNKTYLNKVVPVLIEGISEKDNTKLFGYTDTMKLVNVAGDIDNIGKIINVKITEAKSFSLDGKEVKIKEAIN